VLTGLVLSLVELLPHLRNLKFDAQVDRHDTHIELELQGRATFLSLPGLIKILESLPSGGRIRLSCARLAHLDHTCNEVLVDWMERCRRAGTQIELAGAEPLFAGAAGGAGRADNRGGVEVAFPREAKRLIWWPRRRFEEREANSSGE
jgi:ABC-type transporter Mla MlaB component